MSFRLSVFYSMSQTEQNPAQRLALKHASIFSFFTIISRILGLLRELLKSYIFGLSYLATAFDIAFRIPNMLRNLFAEGAMTQAILPTYEQYKAKYSDSRQAITSIIIYVLFVLLLLYGLLFYYSPALASWLLDTKTIPVTTIGLTAQLLRILFPYLICISLIAILIAIQYSHGIFWSSSGSSAFLNLFLISIFSLYYFCLRDKEPLRHSDIIIFAYILLVGSFVALVFHLFFSHHRQIGMVCSFRLSHPILKKVWVLILPAMFGASLQQISQLTDIYLATQLKQYATEAVSSLVYAHRILHLPIGIFGVALSTSALSSLSKAEVNKDHATFQSVFFSFVRVNIFLLLPASIGLYVLSEPIIKIVYERGIFDAQATYITSIALKYYAPGLLFFSLQKLFVSALYAQGRVRLTVWMTFLGFILNIIVSIHYMSTLFHGGIALGSSLSAIIVSIIYLYLLLSFSHMKMSMISLLPILKLLFLNICFLFFAWGCRMYWLDSVKYSNYFSMHIICVVLCSLLFYGLLAKLLRLSELNQIIQIMKASPKKSAR